jgi:hypothetical protein
MREPKFLELDRAEQVPALYGECPYCGLPADGRVCDRCRALAVEAAEGNQEALQTLRRRASAG